jgi:hypothetical protein
MELEQTPATIVALYPTFADAEATLNALEAAGVPYPAIRLAVHEPADLARATIAERTSLAGITAPDRFWSLGVALEQPWADKAEQVLREHQPFAIGTLPAPDHGRSDTDRGAIAWRHYVFESRAATDQAAGTTGTTGISTSGVFANGAQAAGTVSVPGMPADDQRSSDTHPQPTSDTMRPTISTDRSRPETELKQ